MRWMKKRQNVLGEFKIAANVTILRGKAITVTRRDKTRRYSSPSG